MDNCSIRVLGPVTVDSNGNPTLKDLGSKSINKNGHSICLRIDYGNARILLTGDLNKKSMDYLTKCYGKKRLKEEFGCDVAKACHHGSEDISYKFLKAMRPAATVISSGDAEGHAHPRPEVVAASAVTGFLSVCNKDDRLLTPLVYMTEVERSVSLGAVNRINFTGLPNDTQTIDGALPGRPLEELSKKKKFSPTEEAKIDSLPNDAEKHRKKKKLKDRIRSLEKLVLAGDMQSYYYCSVPGGSLPAKLKEKPVWGSHVMVKNHYGLVNVRTDGKLIMCATRDETEQDWIIHSFRARFPTPTLS